MEDLFPTECLQKGKKKNRQVISLPKAPLVSMAEKKPSTEGNKFKHLKGEHKNIGKCNFNTAFALACMIKYYNESCAEDRSNRLQFA